MIEIPFEKAFFGEKGITSTSANFLANIAKEKLNDSQKFLENISFYNTDVSYIGSSNKSRVRKSVSKTDFQSIKKRIHAMCVYNSFIAWVREAIKEKERLLNTLKSFDFYVYLSMNNIELERPVRKSEYDSEDALREMSVGQRFLYLNAEAYASTYGQIIHPNKPLSKARQVATELLNNPIQVVGEGRDALVYENSFDFSSGELDQLFFELQDTYRSYEKTLNNIKYSVKERVFNTNAQRTADYRNAIEAYESRRDALNAEFIIWRDGQINEAHALKIVIPDNLKDVFEKLNKIGKVEKA